MDRPIVYSKDLTKADTLILKNLEADIKDVAARPPSKGLDLTNGTCTPITPHPLPRHVETSPTCSPTKLYLGQAQDSSIGEDEAIRDEAALQTMMSLNDPKNPNFEPTVFNGWDLSSLGKLEPALARLLKSYIRLGDSLVRVETDVVFLTHLILYFTTSVPSALLLFNHFTWFHGILHLVMQISYTGTYTLMMHQHIHGRGILKREHAWFDLTFPYLLDPLMGHTWNSYFYHHVKHHHVEGNGPDDLSSTIRYQRDNVWHFLHYVGRFYLLVWFDLPLYFIRKNRVLFAAKAAFWELSCYAFHYTMFKLNPRASLFVFLLPLAVMRFGLMIGNWGQHALVDRDEPDSDYRSSITLLDVPVSCISMSPHVCHDPRAGC